MDKPILLLDVDGVLNVIKDDVDPIRLPVPRSIQTDCIINFFGGAEDEPAADHEVQFWPNPFCNELLAWADKNTELWWCTAWFGRANAIGKLAGIPVKPWISTALSEKGEDWKLTNVKDVFANDTRRIIWIEDGFANETEAWAKARPDTHLIKTAFKIGLTSEIMAAVKLLA